MGLVPVHEPTAAVSVCPCTAEPEMLGGEVLTGDEPCSRCTPLSAQRALWWWCLRRAWARQLRWIWPARMWPARLWWWARWAVLRANALAAMQAEKPAAIVTNSAKRRPWEIVTGIPLPVAASTEKPFGSRATW